MKRKTQEMIYLGLREVLQSVVSFIKTRDLLGKLGKVGYLICESNSKSYVYAVASEPCT